MSSPTDQSANQPSFEVLWHRVLELKSRGQFDAALSVATALLEEMRKQKVSVEDLAEVASTTGILHRQVGEYAQAEILYDEALRLRRELFGEMHPAVAASLTNLGALYCATDRFQEAEAVQREAVEIKERLLGPNHPDLPVSLSNLAVTCIRLGKHAEAEALLDRALAIQLASEATPRLIETHLNRSALFEAIGRFNDMVSSARDAYEASRRLLPAGHPTILNCLRNLAARCRDTGRFEECVTHYEIIVDTLEQALGRTHPDAIRATIWLGMGHYGVGDFRRAEAAYERALAAARTMDGGRNALVAGCLSNLGALYRTAGSLERAGETLREALELAREVSDTEEDEIALAMNNLGALYRQQGDRRASRPLLEGAIAIQRRSPTARPQDLAMSLNNLALLLWEERDYGGARQAYEEAYGIVQRTLGKEHPQTAIVLNNLAEANREMERYAEAEELQLEANQLLERAHGPSHSTVERGLLNLSKTYMAVSRHADALSAQLRAAEINDDTMASVFSIGSQQARKEYLATVVANLHALLSLVVQHFGESEDAVMRALDLVFRRKAIVAAVASAQRAEVFSGPYKHLEQKLRDLSDIRTEIARLSLEPSGAGEVAAARQRIKPLESKRDRLEEELARELPVDAEGRRRGANVASVRAALPRNSALIEFVRFESRDYTASIANGKSVWGAERYVAFLVHADERERVRLFDLADAKGIDGLVSRLRNEIVSFDQREGGASADDAGNGLRSLVFDAVANHLGGCTRLFIAPDGDLMRLPFEVLPLPDGRRMIDQYEISYLTCGRDALRLISDRPTSWSAPVVVADPDFDLSLSGGTSAAPGSGSADHAAAMHYPRLFGTRIEGQRIARLLGVRPLLGADANETRIKAIASPQIVHIASHGFFFPEATQWATGDGGIRTLAIEAPSDGSAVHLFVGKIGGESFGVAKTVAPGRLAVIGLQGPMLRSGIVLAGANTWLRGGALPPEAEDALLTAEDVASLNLLSTELVVLSACETGLGEVHISEGVQGLRCACVLAGARTLIMSLWKVDDDQTQMLMEEFYRRLLLGESRSASLRAAQLAVRAMYPEPYYWGAFICDGDPRSLA